MISEIAKSYLNCGKETRSMFFYRDRNQKEIDLLSRQSDQLYPLEIKSTTHPRLEMAKNFSVLKETELVHVQTGTILCQIERDYVLSDRLQALPVAFL